jgi:hypothetical protein
LYCVVCVSLYSNESSVLGLATCHGSAHSTKPERGGQLATDELVLLHSNRVRSPSLNAHNSVCHIACSSILFLTDNRGSKRFSDRAGSRVARQLPPPTPTPTPTPHTHTHTSRRPSTSIQSIYTQATHTGPCSATSKTRPLDNATARRGPSTTPQQARRRSAAPRRRPGTQDVSSDDATRNEIDETRQFSSAGVFSMPLLPLLDLNLVLLFFLIGTHSLPTAFIIGREHFG